MRALLTALLLATLAATGQAAEPNATYGEHGMALFGGKDGLYASHLPMFHAPHDYQVVLQFHLANREQDSALRARLDGKTALWTIAPEKFELNRLAPGAAAPLTQFKADLVTGHFEQGGKTAFAGATVVVDKVLLYRQLAPAAHTSASARYVQIGSGGTRFLVKEIDSRPDFDHIVAIRTAASKASAPISVTKTGLAEPQAAVLASALGGATVLGDIYFSADDLK